MPPSRQIQLTIKVPGRPPPMSRWRMLKTKELPADQRLTPRGGVIANEVKRELSIKPFSWATPRLLRDGVMR